MTRLLLQDVLETGHLISDESTCLLILQAVDLPLVIFYLLIYIFQFLLDDVGRGLVGDQLVLLLDRRLVPLLVEHLVYLDDLVFQFSVTLLQLLDVLGPEWKRGYLMSSESFYFSRIL